MNPAGFERLIADEYPRAVPEKFRGLLKNVAFLVEDEPSREIRREEKLAPGETLLGLYRGIPHARRGDQYGLGPTVPDVIILFRLPIHDEAQMRVEEEGEPFDEALRTVVGETIWHEVAHYLGLNEQEVRGREALRAADPSRLVRVAQNEGAAMQNTPMNSQKSSLYRGGERRLSVEELEQHAVPVPLQPIEVDREDPRLAKRLHRAVISESPLVDSSGEMTKDPYENNNNSLQKQVEPPDNLPMLDE